LNNSNDALKTKNMNQINLQLLTQVTGDPFADTGAWALEIFQKEHSGEDILQIIERAAKIYVNHWDAKINPFFLNSTITQPAFKGERRIEETLKYFRGLLTETEPNQEGVCRILGQHAKLFPAGRSNHIMSGSGNFINFHHAFEPGVMLSKEVLIRIFFVPLGAVFVGNRVAVIGSNDTKVEKWFVKDIVTKNLARIATQTSEGIYKSPYGNPANTLFESVKKWVNDYDIPDDATVEVNLYHFTNFGASPEITLYSFSARLFRFYRKVLHRDFVADWQRFVRSHYRPPKETVYREQDDTFFTESKKIVAQVEEETVKGFYNLIYVQLLTEKNILALMAAWCVRQYKAQRPFKFFHIATLYQTFLRDMKEETLRKIEHIADIVVNNDEKRKKWLSALLRVKHDASFRDFLIQVMREQNRQNVAEPVIGLRDYDRYFLSDGVFARETRDLILISIYEKLSERHIVDDTDVPDEELVEETN